MFKITKMTFNMNINSKSNNKEMKVTLDDDYNDVFRRVISCPNSHMFCIVFISYNRNRTHSLPSLGHVSFLQRGSVKPIGISPSRAPCCAANSTQ